MYVFTTIESDRIDFKTLKTILSDSRVSMCRDIYAMLGVEVGAVSPFGYEEGVILVIDERVFQVSPHAYINPGLNNISLKIRSSDLRMLMEASGAIVVDFTS